MLPQRYTSKPQIVSLLVLLTVQPMSGNRQKLCSLTSQIFRLLHKARKYDQWWECRVSPTSETVKHVFMLLLCCCGSRNPECTEILNLCVWFSNKVKFSGFHGDWWLYYCLILCFYTVWYVVYSDVSFKHAAFHLARFPPSFQSNKLIQYSITAASICHP